MHPIQGPQVRNTFTGRHPGLLLLILAFLVLLLLAVISRPAAAASEARRKILDGGKQEYTEHCVSCHGADGKGGGPLAAKLVKPPKDLTAIAVLNGGIFPFWIVFDMVSGETPVAGHDTHQMPEYYDRMKAQDFKPGYAPAQLRLLSLIHYLESIQGEK